MDAEKKYDVFISHSTDADGVLANTIVAYLEEKGLVCWIAPRNVDKGKAYLSEIRNGIFYSRMMLLIFNANSNRSRYVKPEVERAYNYNLPLLPFRTDATIVAEELELILSQFQWLDAIHGDPEIYFEKLYIDCRNLIGRPDEMRYSELMKKGLSLISNGSFSEAIGIFQEALKIFPQKEAAHAQLQVAISSLNKKNAEEIIIKIIEETNTLFEQKKYDEATLILQQAIQLDSKNGKVIELSARIKKAQQAVTSLQQAVFVQAFTAEDYTKAKLLGAELKKRSSIYQVDIDLLTNGNIAEYENVKNVLEDCEAIKINKYFISNKKFVIKLKELVLKKESISSNGQLTGILLPHAKLTDRYNSIEKRITGYQNFSTNQPKRKTVGQLVISVLAISLITVAIYYWNEANKKKYTDLSVPVLVIDTPKVTHMPDTSIVNLTQDTSTQVKTDYSNTDWFTQYQLLKTKIATAQANRQYHQIVDLAKKAILVLHPEADAEIKQTQQLIIDNNKKIDLYNINTDKAKKLVTEANALLAQANENNNWEKAFENYKAANRLSNGVGNTGITLFNKIATDLEKIGEDKIKVDRYRNYGIEIKNTRQINY